MLKISDVTDGAVRMLKHGGNVFHEAISYVTRGEKEFYVTNPQGDDYGLTYEDNNSMIPGAAQDEGKRFFPDFYEYDERDREKLCLEIFEGYESIFFDTADEYTVVLIGVLLADTQLKICCTDKRVLYFHGESDRLTLLDMLPPKTDREMFVTYGPHVGFINGDYSRLCPQALFYSVFFFQYLTDLPMENIRYAEITVPERVGIGGLLTHYMMMKNAFGARGIRAYLKPGSTRFGDELIGRFFNIEFTPVEAEPGNTVYVTDFDHCCAAFFIYRYKSVPLDDSILNDKLTGEIEEYREDILGNRRCLGVLARGTDYTVGDYGADRHHATAGEMIPLVRRWISEYGYEIIFLATEDQGILEEFKAAFPGRVRAIAQERHRAEDFGRGELIYEKERREKSGEAYRNSLIDTTVNYFYAIYILSSCSAFIASGQCNGWDTVLSFNHGRFERSRRFMIDIEGNPATEDFRYICDLHSGMAARNVMPRKLPLTITLGFRLKKHVSRAALEAAFARTIQIYPYFKRAILFRDRKYIMAEDPLDFVIADGNRVVPPSTAEAGFHMVTVSCHEGELKLAFDHAGTDGEAVVRFVSTLLYYYFSEQDGTEYEVPEGAYSLRNLPMDGQDEDAFLRVMPVMKEETAEQAESLSLPEFAGDPQKEGSDRGSRYLISVDAEQFRAYFKSIGGTPQSALSLLTAESLQATHPGNTLPVKISLPISIRKIFKNEKSMMSQIVAAEYLYDPGKLEGEAHERELIHDYRSWLNDMTSEEGITRLAGQMRGMLEQFKVLTARGMSDFAYKKVMEAGHTPVNVSMVGSVKLSKEYAAEVEEAYIHYIPRDGLSVHMLEAGHRFHIVWSQGSAADAAVRDFLDSLRSRGMTDVRVRKLEE